jgi:hypothetical protein
MKKQTIIISLFALVALSSCSESTKEEHASSTPEKVAHTEDHSDQHSEEVEGLSLNNGEKWGANKETHDGMGEIKAVLESSSPNTVEEFQVMGDSCSVQTKFIINNCSMTGESHNQLHFVLHPILDNIDGLKKATTTDEGKLAYKELAKNIEDYFTFFSMDK